MFVTSDANSWLIGLALILLFGALLARFVYLDVRQRQSALALSPTTLQQEAVTVISTTSMTFAEQPPEMAAHIAADPLSDEEEFRSGLAAYARSQGTSIDFVEAGLLYHLVYKPMKKEVEP